MGRQHKGMVAQSAAFSLCTFFYLATTTRVPSDLWVLSPHSCAPWLIIQLLPTPVELRPKINHQHHTCTPGFCHSLSNRPRQASFRFSPFTWLNLIAEKTMKSNLYSWSPRAKVLAPAQYGNGERGEVIQGGRHWLSPTAVSSLENSLSSKGLSMPSLSSIGSCDHM